MTDAERLEARKILGDAAKDFDNDTLDSALIVYSKRITENALNLSAANKELSDENLELSAANTTLTDQLVELSAKADEVDTVEELSAATIATQTENVTMKIDAAAKAQSWPVAYHDKVKAAFVKPDVIALSANAGEDTINPGVFLDLLAERPAPALIADGKSATGAQDLTLLSRAGTDEPDAAAASPAAAVGANPWDDEIAKINAQAERMKAGK